MNTIRNLSLCCAIVVTTLLTSRVEAQKQVIYINSGDSIDRGINFADTGAYARASALYEMVSENDTNYALALIEDAIAKESYEQDSAAIVVSRKGLNLESPYMVDFYNTIASVYMDEGNYDDAITLLKDTVLQKYPNIHGLYYTLGIAQYKTHKYTDAESSFERAIDLDIYDASSHYYLGKCCLEEGRLIPAMLSLQFYLLLQPSVNRSYNVVELLEEMTENKYQYNKRYKADPAQYHDSAFTELDLLIRSKIALNSQYKATTDINYTFIKPLQLFFEQLKYVPNTGNYWMEKYVPFFTGIQQKNFLEPYLYYIMASVSNNDPTLQKGILKDKKAIKKFAKWAEGELLAKRSKIDMVIGDKKVTVDCEYWDNNMLESTGHKNSAGKDTGLFTYYYSHTGAVYNVGRYNSNGEKQGTWKWFYNTGKLKEIDNFVNDKKEDTAKLWYDNGALKAVYIFHNDLLDGDAWEYNVSGILTSHTTYKQGKLSGTANYYYYDGKQHYLANYADNKLTGELKEYYATGQLKSTKIMLNDEKNGVYTTYWANGKVNETGEYKNDKRNGLCKIYYMDGSLQKVGNFSDKGDATGTWLFYFRNGKKEESEPFNKNGQVTGTDSLFDRDGVLYETQIYRDDVLQESTFMDKNGHVVGKNKLDDRNTTIANYSPQGIKSSEGTYINGKKDGKWKYYNYYGRLSAIENYEDNNLDGVSIYYFTNGNVKDSLHYKSGNEDGYYVSYYINGQMNTQGWYKNGSKEGDWYYYDLKGNITKHNFYQGGDLHGHSDFYESNGLLSEQHYYHDGYIDKIVDYDTSGAIEYKYISDKGNGKYLSHYSNGQINHELNYINGSWEGPERRYFYNGQLSKEDSYLLDNTEGPLKAYYRNGNTRYVYHYINDNCEDTGRTYHENGKPDEVSHYYDDELDGEDRNYDEEGNLTSIANYYEGDLDGIYRAFQGNDLPAGIFWFDDGNVIAYASTDSKGAPVKRVALDSGSGRAICYYPNGNKSVECDYYNGAISGKRLSYSPNGNINSDETLISGYRNGIQKYYYLNDTTLKEDDSYYYGELDGVSHYYYKNGQLEHDETYVLGSLQGPSRYYDEDGNLVKTIYYYGGNEITETTVK